MKRKYLFVFIAMILIVSMLYVVYSSGKRQKQSSSAQPSRIVIGFLSLRSNPSHELMVSAVKMEIRKTVKNVTFIQDDIQDNTLFPAAAKRLVDSNVSLIIANSTPAVKAASEATDKIPIVFGGVGDPIANNIVKSLDSSGTNVTGISSLSVELTAKRLEIFHTLFPLAKKVFFIYQPNEIGSENSKVRTTKVADELGITLVEKPVNSVTEAMALSDTLRGSEGKAIILAANGMVWSAQSDYIRTQNREKIPVIGVDNLMAENGALVSYGPNYSLMGAQLAKMVLQVLNGTPPQYIPIQRPDKVELIINKKTVDITGLSFTQEQLKEADRIIY